MHSIVVSTSRKHELIDITEKVCEAVKGFESGLCTVFVQHTTAAVTINENADPNICTDILGALDMMLKGGRYLHDHIDGNASAHIKASLIGPSVSVPVKGGRLQLGRWQAVMLAEFDGPRKRTVLVQLT